MDIPPGRKNLPKQIWGCKSREKMGYLGHKMPDFIDNRQYYVLNTLYLIDFISTR